MNFAIILEELADGLSVFRIASIFVVVLFVYYRLFRRRIASILDPLAYTVFFSTGTVTLLFVLSARSIVSTEKLLFTLATLLLFYGAFYCITVPPGRSMVQPRTPRNQSPPRTLAVLFGANTILLLITYSFFGIPLLMESRLALWSGGGGVGAIGRLSGGLQFVSVLLGFVALYDGTPRKLWAKLLIAQFVLSAMLSGSKGSLLTGIYAWYLAQVYVTGSWRVGLRLTPTTLLVTVIVFISPLLVIVIQNREQSISLLEVAFAFIMRVAAEGDGYVYFFADDVIDQISHFDLLALLRPILTGLRIVSADTAFNPGFEVVREVFVIDDPVSGPNSRLPIYLIYFYGYAGIVLAPLLGMMLGHARNVTLRSTGGTAMRFSVAGAVYLLCTKLEADPQITMNGLFDLFLAAPVLLFAKLCGRPYRMVAPKPPVRMQT